jgi:hypothetical protein
MVQLPVVGASAAAVQVLVWVKSVAGEIATLDTVSEPEPVLAKVRLMVEEEVPTTVAGKVSEAGEGLKSARPAVDVPLSVAIWGELEALSTTATEPTRVPTAVGVKVTVTVHVPPAARLPAQVEVSEKSEALLPDTTTLLIVIAEEFPLVRVSVCVGELTPTLELAKVSDDTLKLTEPVDTGGVPPPPQPVRRDTNQ